jgi:hypothetical protein
MPTNMIKSKQLDVTKQKTKVIAKTRHEIEFLKNISIGQPITYPSQN